MQAQPDDAWRESLGRLALVGLVIVLAVAAQQLLQPRGGVFAEFLRIHPQSWGSRFQRIWHPVMVGTPVALAVIALGGYTYTAYHLAQRLYGTAWLFVLLLLLHAGGQRLLLMARRRLLVDQARKKREAALAERRAQREEGAPAPEMPAVAVEEEVDFARLDAQARQLLRVTLAFALVIGLWWVWVDIFPALNILRRVELWHTTSAIAQVVPLPGGEAAAATPGGETVVAVTLADLALSLVFLILTIAAVRNIPGLLEISLLQRLQLESSVRFAITALSRYLLMILGTLVIFGSLGVGWNKVQWLVAAMTVGLGFGLQEIFANFVSGLILLFERPIRIGDIVTVGGTSGQVSQIRMRATTITDFERRELIVPNKEFITGSLVNWTLSNSVTRTHITVGVAYGTDTIRARALMQELAEGCEHVLKDPPPFTVFKAFGDNSLELRLYVYLPRTDALWPATNALMTGIDEAFKANGISIAFPQRHLHLETAGPLEFRLAPGAPPSEP
jgi:potassium efflux system protein